MLARLSSRDFLPQVGQPCTLVLTVENGAPTEIPAILDRVDENPLARHPRANADTRTPFSLLFRAPADCPWGDGTYTLRLQGRDDIPQVFMNRILNIDPVPAAVFQAVFN